MRSIMRSFVFLNRFYILITNVFFDSTCHKVVSRLLKATTQEAVVKRCSQKSRKIHRKTLVPESVFYKVAGLMPTTLFKKRL